MAVSVEGKTYYRKKSHRETSGDARNEQYYQISRPKYRLKTVNRYVPETTVQRPIYVRPIKNKNPLPNNKNVADSVGSENILTPTKFAYSS